MSRQNCQIQTAQRKIVRLQKAIAIFDVVCSGNLRRRVLICGKENCRCKGKVPALHGPYHYWSRRHEGKFLQRVLSATQAKMVDRAIRNYKSIRGILSRWEQETVKIIETQTKPKG